MADLLIRGASLPKDKEQIFVIFPDGAVNVVEKGTPYYEAIELPDHGRLIDADALWERVNSYSDNEGAHKDAKMDDEMISRDSALYLIDEADTIIPASKEGGA